jgi:hypothetical protein
MKTEEVFAQGPTYETVRKFQLFRGGHVADGTRYLRRRDSRKFARRKYLWSVLAIGLGYALFTYSFKVTYREANRELDPDFLYPSEPLSRSPDRVSIWLPHSESCDGQFVAYSQLKRSDPYLPVLLLREASVDYRHVSIKEYRERRNHASSFRRILLAVTVVPEQCDTFVTGPLMDAGSRLLHRSEISFPNGTKSDELDSRIDFFVSDEQRCARWCHRDAKCRSYVDVCRMKEWQFILTITPQLKQTKENAFLERLEGAALANASLSVYLPLQLRARGTETFKLQVGFSCIAGLTTSTKIPASLLLPARKSRCEDAKGAVVISGAPLFGSHLHDRASWRRVAHFAARSIFGTMWFDTVAVGVHPVYSMSHIQDKCGRLETDREIKMCIQSHHGTNLGLLQAIAREIEAEFVALGIPKSEWARLILFPICRLGSDHRGLESGEPCLHSHHGGQRVMAHVGYTMFAPHHAWATNIDIDEFIVDESGASTTHEQGLLQRWLSGAAVKTAVKAVSAAEQFDRVRAIQQGTSIVMPWLDIRVTPENERSLVKDVISGKKVAVRGFDDWAGPTFNKNRCYTRENHGDGKIWGGGKVAQHCQDGLSFMIHDPFNLEKSTDKLDLSKVDCPDRDWSGRPPQIPIYTYHARLATPRSSKCEYGE